MKRILSVAVVLLFLYHCRSNLGSTTDNQNDNLSDDQDREQNPNRVAGLAPVDINIQDTREADSVVGGVKIAAPEKWTEFNFPIPQAPHKESLQLWATYYYTPVLKTSASKTNAVRDEKETSILGNEKLTRQEWCSLALQGSAIVFNSLGIKYTISFAGRSSVNRVDCSNYIESEEVSKKIAGNRFRFSDAIYGTGARSRNVIPFRTIAVDPNHIPYGSVLYIPSARNARFTDGKMRRAHDGYFFAGDTGSAILGNHIDVFTGTNNRTPFEFVKSSSSGAFQAILVDEPHIKKTLSDWHGFIE